MMCRLQIRLAQHEVSFGYWAFLRILQITDGLTRRELSGKTGMTMPITLSVVPTMKKFGYVECHYVLGNHKNTHVYLTVRGRNLRDKLIPLAEEVNKISVRDLKTMETNITREVFLMVIENMARDKAEMNDPTLQIPSAREMGSLIASRGEG